MLRAGGGGPTGKAAPRTRVRRNVPMFFNAGSSTTIPWTTATQDILGTWNIADPTKIIVPVGYSKGIFSFCQDFNVPVGAGAGFAYYLEKNGVLNTLGFEPTGGCAFELFPAAGGESGICAATSDLITGLVGGIDYFELLNLNSNAVAGLYNVAAWSWFNATWFR